VRDSEQGRWLQALVWPEHHERATRLAQAIETARRKPRRLVRGDALTCLPELLRDVPRDAVVCVVHTHTLNQMTEDRRVALTALLHDEASDRVLYRVSAEWLATTHPVLELTSWPPTGVVTRRLAFCDTHGEWIEWLV